MFQKSGATTRRQDTKQDSFPSEHDYPVDMPVDLAVTTENSLFILSAIRKPALRHIITEDFDRARLHKVDATGRILWKINLGFPESWDTPIGLVPANDEGVYVVCSSYQRMLDRNPRRGLIFRISKSGQRMWFRHVGGNDNAIRSVAMSADGGILVSGWAWYKDNGISGAWITHYSSNGSKLWDYVHDKNTDDHFVSFGHLVVLSDKRIVALYHTNDLGNGALYWGRSSIVTLDLNGKFVSKIPVGQQAHAAEGNISNIPQQILKTGDGGLIITLAERVWGAAEISDYQVISRGRRTKRSTGFSKCFTSLRILKTG